MLDEKQSALILEIALSKNDYVVLGKAGAGKTTTMEALTEIYNKQGYQIIGLSTSGAVSANLYNFYLNNTINMNICISS